MTALTEYPPVGTRVRWTSRGKRREGVVQEPLAVVLVDKVNGRPVRGARRYYRPRPEWLEVVEEAKP